MPRKKLPSKNKTQRAEGNSIPWRYCFLTLACGLILVVGFFLAARQHFSSVDFGIKNSKLRRQIEELEASKRRLILAKEIALSPAEIKKAAQKIGLREMTASNIEVYRPNTGSTEKPVEKLTEKPAEKPKVEKAVEEKVKHVTSTKLEEIKKEDKKPEKEIQAVKKPPADKDKADKDKANKEKKDKTKTQIARK